jgi:hypothetical protein
MIRQRIALRTTRAAVCLMWEALSVDVRWRPLPSLVIVPHLVARPLAPTKKPGRRIFP